MARTLTVLTVLLALALPLRPVAAHCQVPCGIYGDELRFQMMAENLDSIEKAMKRISELSARPAENFQQEVRWTMMKDQHADELARTLTAYFSR